ncbi:MAG: hypothetical protein H0W61_17955, partial [Bacteroidetes bacterium]|nr:hypothetical protein [Bacteroidota bacterium]
MKKVILILPVLALLISSCKTSQLVAYSDDVYSSPSEDKRIAQLAAAEKAKKETAEKQEQELARQAQKAKDDANPYYKDPSYNKDDYYDYQYASRVKRFGSPVNGAGYYDNYYTNSYWYNQNPACYGTSIYSSYNYLMPSNQFNNYSNGLSFGMGYGNGYGSNSYGQYSGYGCSNPYGYNGYNSAYTSGYNNGYSSGMYGYGYNPYGYSSYGSNPYGYNSYGSGSSAGNNGWGYFNSHDANSGYSHYGVRGSSGGGNSTRATSAGMPVPQEYQNERGKMIEMVQQQQESAPRFTEVPRQTTNITKGNYDNQGNNNTTQPGRNVLNNNTSVDNGQGVNNGSGNTPRGSST